MSFSGEACNNSTASHEDMMFSFSSSVESEEIDGGGGGAPSRMSFGHELFFEGHIRPLASSPSASSSSASTCPSPLHSDTKYNYPLVFSHAFPQSLIHKPPSHASKPRRWFSLSALKQALFCNDPALPELLPCPSFAYYLHCPSNVADSSKKLEVLSTQKSTKASRKGAPLQSKEVYNTDTQEIHNVTRHSIMLDSSKAHHEAPTSSTHQPQSKLSFRELFMLKKEDPRLPKASKGKCQPLTPQTCRNSKKVSQTKSNNNVHCAKASMNGYAREDSKFKKSNARRISSPNYSSMTRLNVSNTSGSPSSSPLRAGYHKPLHTKRRKTLLPYRQVFLNCLGFNMEHSYYKTY